MKPRFLHHPDPAFSLLELLLIVLALAILAAMLVPEYRAARQYKLKSDCENNLKQVVWSFQAWGNDHNGKFPMQLSQTDGGTEESVESGKAAPSFQVLSNELKDPKFLICPADRIRMAATNFSSHFTGANISYFVGVDATAGNPWAFLSGDDNFVLNGVRVKSGLLELSTNGFSDWWQIPLDYTDSRHEQSGNIAFADGRMGGTHNGYFGAYLSQTGFATNRLAIP